MRYICLCALLFQVIIHAFAPIRYAPSSIARGSIAPNIAWEKGRTRLPNGMLQLGGTREALWGRLAKNGEDRVKKPNILLSRVKQILLMISLPFILAARRVSAKELKVTESQKESITRLQMDYSDTRSTESYHKKARIFLEAKGDSTKAKRTRIGVNHENQNYEDIKAAIHGTEMEVSRTWSSLLRSLEGTKLDGLILLLSTSVVIPLFKALRKSSILGFLLTGTILGPNGLNIFTDIHRIDLLGELGIVFFLFEMGLDLSLDRLKAMRKDVFGLGTTTFAATTLMGTAIAQACGLSVAASIALSSSLSLSSSAFVLQLLKDKGAFGERYGKQAFGILLLQDLAVVPVLVVIELLSGPSAAISKALSVAAIKAVVTLSTMSFFGRRIVDPLFDFVAKSDSEEAFISITLTMVLLMSFVTQGIGLSNTLGAFLAGLLLAETKFRHQVEADIAPYRGLLLGIFFITVGFSIDLKLFVKEAPRILAILGAMVGCKATAITASSMAFGSPPGPALQTGLLTAQGGEFAFVAFAIAERSKLISTPLKKILLTTVALSMALTPALAGLGEGISHFLESKKSMRAVLDDATHILEDAVHVLDDAAHGQLPSRKKKADGKGKPWEEDYVLVCGYGRVGKTVCDMLKRKNIKYVAVDNSPKKSIEARNQNLPVYFGDITRPEVLRFFQASKAKKCILTIDDMQATNKAIISIKKLYPSLPLVVRAKDTDHKLRLEEAFSDVEAYYPLLPDDSTILTLPFGGAVLQSIGVAKAEADDVVDDLRHEYIEAEDDNVREFFQRFRRLPPSAVPSKNELLELTELLTEDLATLEAMESRSDPSNDVVSNTADIHSSDIDNETNY